MKDELELNAMPETPQEPKAIAVLSKGSVIARVFIDGAIRFTAEVSLQQYKKISIIAENFSLFYKNIGGK